MTKMQSLVAMTLSDFLLLLKIILKNERKQKTQKKNKERKKNLIFSNTKINAFLN